MTLDDTIEPESKFVSVQQCQRPIMIAKLMLFIQIRTIVIKKVLILFAMQRYNGYTNSLFAKNNYLKCFLIIFKELHPTIIAIHK